MAGKSAPPAQAPPARRGEAKGAPQPNRGGARSERLTALFHRTKMCKFHILGICARGAECKFAHDQVELQAPPILYHTKMCPALSKSGRCTEPDCRYAHRKEDLKPLPSPTGPRPAKPAPPPSFTADREAMGVPVKVSLGLLSRPYSASTLSDADTATSFLQLSESAEEYNSPSQLSEKSSRSESTTLMRDPLKIVSGMLPRAASDPDVQAVHLANKQDLGVARVQDADGARLRTVDTDVFWPYVATYSDWLQAYSASLGAAADTARLMQAQMADGCSSSFSTHGPSSGGWRAMKARGISDEPARIQVSGLNYQLSP